MPLPPTTDRPRSRRLPEGKTVIRLGAALALAGLTWCAANVVGGRLDDASRKQTVSQAELVAEIGFATAMSDGELTAADTRGALAQTAVAREALGISRVVVWDREGAVFSDPGPVGSESPPPLVRRVLSDGATHSGPSSEHGRQRGLSVVVPLGQDYAAQLDFAHGPMEDTLTTARRVVYALIVAEAIAVYLAMGPALSWAAERVPTRSERRRALAAERVRQALDDRELELWFQPKVAVTTGVVVGVEGLLRWRHPTRGVVLPAEVIDVAERDERLLDDLTTRVVTRAAEAAAHLSAARVHLPIAVNISPATFRRRRVPDMVDAALAAAGAQAGALGLEITESALMGAGDDVVDAVHQLRRRGLAVSLDDFGTGHSSLQRLADLPLDELKIDRSFTASMTSDARERRVVTLIVDLAKDLGMRVTAEGVETTAQLEALTALGCDVMQGYLVARPMPEQDLLLWLDQHTEPAGPAHGGATRRRISTWPPKAP